MQEVELLRDWFLASSRDLPWRSNPSPYAVWISEVMLQQTQAAVVIPYFQHWMERFPTIESLACASPDEVLKLWEGLGYYSRARNLHEGARHIVQQFGGEIPGTFAGLKQIKGIGAYTAGAILNFAFHQRAAAVDGNVLRVLARYYGLSDDISKPQTMKKMGRIAEELLPDQEPWVISEALIELGATVCMKKPECADCPLKRGCEAFKKGITSQLPVKSGNQPTTQLFRAVAVIIHEKRVLVAQGGKGKVMEGLWEFPYFELEAPRCDAEWIQAKVTESFKFETAWQKPLEKVSHSFTRYRAHLFPHLLHAKERAETGQFHWIGLDALKTLPFSSGHRRILPMLSPEGKESV
jgi:A/G-specific adenine glycosylase